MSQSSRRWLGPNDLVAPSEAGNMFGMTPDAVRVLNNRGGLDALKTLGGRRLFRLSVVEKLARAEQQGAGCPIERLA